MLSREAAAEAATLPDDSVTQTTNEKCRAMPGVFHSNPKIEPLSRCSLDRLGDLLCTQLDLDGILALHHHT